MGTGTSRTQLGTHGYIGEGESNNSVQPMRIHSFIQMNTICIRPIKSPSSLQESDTGLAPPALWDLAADKQALQTGEPLQVARCTKIIDADTDEPKYIINVKQFAKFVVNLHRSLSPKDIEEGMRVGVGDRNKYEIHLPLPPKIDPTVTMMQVCIVCLSVCLLLLLLLFIR